MFSQEEEIRTDESEEEEQSIRQFKNHTPERFLCPYAGGLSIIIDKSTMTKVPEERFESVKRFFINIEAFEPVAKKNLIVLILLTMIYFIINIFHICNIFVLGNKPLIYVNLVWLQH